MPRLIIPILFLLCSSFAFGQTLNKAQIQNINDRLIEKKESLESYVAAVILESHSSLFVNPRHTSYNMSYLKPGMFRIEKMEGDREVLVFNNDKVYRSYNGGELETMGNVRMASMMNDMITQIISGAYLNSEEFDVEYSTDEDTYILQLNPTKKALAKKIESIELILSNVDLGIQELTVFQSFSDFFSYKFTSIEYNTPIDQIIFTPQ